MATKKTSEAPNTELQNTKEFEFEGGVYAFADDAPELILFGGKGLTQEEIAKDEDILLQLIGGKSSLIIKIK